MFQTGKRVLSFACFFINMLHIQRKSQGFHIHDSSICFKYEKKIFTFADLILCFKQGF
jgi:hypothetical protein